MGATLALALMTMLSGCEFWFFFGDDQADLSFTLEWDGSENLDLYMTYPRISDTTTNAPNFDEPYEDDLSTGGTAAIGFYPGNGSGRGTVDWSNKKETFREYGGRAAVELLEDATDGSDEELLVVRGFPFGASATDSSTGGGGDTGLPSGYTYTWVGVMELYAFADSGKISYGSGAGTEAKLVIRDDGDVIGEYALPTDTDLRGASIVRINTFYRDDGFESREYYQIVPDIRLITSTSQIENVSGRGADLSGPAPEMLFVEGEVRP